MLHSVDEGKNTANYLSKHDFNSQYEDDEVNSRMMEHLTNDKRRTMPLSPLVEEVAEMNSNRKD